MESQKHIQQASITKQQILRDPSSASTWSTHIDDSTKIIVVGMAKEHIDQIGQGQPRKLRECLNRDDWQDPQGAQLPGLLYLVGKACGLTRTHWIASCSLWIMSCLHKFRIVCQSTLASVPIAGDGNAKLASAVLGCREYDKIYVRVIVTTIPSQQWDTTHMTKHQEPLTTWPILDTMALCLAPQSGKTSTDFNRLQQITVL